MPKTLGVSWLALGRRLALGVRIGGVWALAPQPETNMSLIFSIADRKDGHYTHRVWDLCHYLTDRVMKPFFARHNVAWERHAEDFFAPMKGATPFEPTGTILFRVPPMFAGQLGELESLIVAELARHGIRLGAFVREFSPDGLSVVRVQIPVTENPTAHCGPPEVNMSLSAGCLVLRDLLGYRQNHGSYEFTADDVLQRLEALTESQVVKCSTRTVRDPSAPGRLRVTQSAATAQRIQRCLEEVRRFAQWAKSHRYMRLRAVS